MRVTAWKALETQEKELEADTSTINERAGAANPRVCGTEALTRLNTSLHEMSQPMTVLLCILEYGVSLANGGGVETDVDDLARAV